MVMVIMGRYCYISGLGFFIRKLGSRREVASSYASDTLIIVRMIHHSYFHLFLGFGFRCHVVMMVVVMPVTVDDDAMGHQQYI